MQQTVAWLPQVSILEKATNVEHKVFSIVCLSRGNLIWGVCIEMGIEPGVWLCIGSRNGLCINKRCINVTLNRGLFIWPHLQKSTRCPPACPWGDRVQLSMTALDTSQIFLLFTHGCFQLVQGRFSVAIQHHCYHCEYFGFSLHRLLWRNQPA